MKVSKRQLKKIIRESMMPQHPMPQGQTATSLAEALADEVLYIVGGYIEDNREVSAQLENAIYEIVARYLNDVNISSDFRNVVRK